MTKVPVPSAREVAKHLDRRQVRRRIILWLLLLGALVLALVYLRCGTGFGLGGSGTGSGTGAKGLVDATDAGTKQCELRLSPEGITVGGKRVTRDEAVAACKQLGRANVTVTGTTLQGDWDDLKTALEAAKVEVFRREPPGAAGSAR